MAQRSNESRLRNACCHDSRFVSHSVSSVHRQIDGFVSAYVYDTGGDELWGVAVFRDEESYRANANDPEQDKWYRRLREHLEADPEWHDGAIRAWPGDGRTPR